MVDRTCQHCGSEMGVLFRKGAKWCSGACSVAAHRAKQANTSGVKECPSCGITKGSKTYLDLLCVCPPMVTVREISDTERRRTAAYAVGDISVSRQKIIQALRDKHGDVCWLCESALLFNVKSDHPLSVHIEHLIPISKGGSHGWDNVALAHASCNVQKGSRLVAFGRWGDSRPMRID